MRARLRVHMVRRVLTAEIGSQPLGQHVDRDAANHGAGAGGTTGITASRHHGVSWWRWPASRRQSGGEKGVAGGEGIGTSAKLLQRVDENGR